MRRTRLIVLVVVSACLLAVLLGGLSLCRYYFPMPGPTSPLFERYKDTPHIRATDLRNFHVNDTLAVDVTLLQATDPTGWETLVKDFNILDMPDDVFELMKTHKKTVAIRVTSKNNIGFDMDKDNIDENYVLAIDFIKRSVGVFHTKNEKEIKSVIRYNFDLNTK